MANPWFRLYAEIITDTKLLAVTEALRWRYVALLCMQCNGVYENTPDDEIALALRVTEKEWNETREIFIKRRLLNEDGSIRKWAERQYISDIKDPTAAERQKRYRENKRNARNDTVTSRLPESDTDTDTDNKKPIDDSFERFYSAYPKKKSRIDAEKAWRKAKPPIDDVLKALEWQKVSDQWTKNKGEYIPYPASYINSGGWMDEPVTSVPPRKGSMDISGIDYNAGVNADGSF